MKQHKNNGKIEPTWHNGTCEYTWELPTQVGYTYATISTPVDQLLLPVEELQSDGVELLHIHDY